MIVQIHIATPDKKSANMIASVLVEDRLAACVQILGPIQSCYTWKDKVEHTEEYLCIVKTVQRHYKAVEKRVISIHPYEVPEILMIEIQDGSSPYVQWIREMTSKDYSAE